MQRWIAAEYRIVFIALALIVAAGEAGAQSSPPMRQTRTKPSSRTPRKITCPDGDYAFCEAATCTATGRTIRGDGGTYPEASCLCPILYGPAMASLHSGNMKGSCDPPPGGVWSLFPPNAAADFPEIPQQSADWATAPVETQDCPASVNGNPVDYAGCFAYACKNYGTINGTRVAECFCRILTTTDPEFATQAGQCNPEACNEIPEGVTRTKKLNKGGRQCK